MILKDLTMKLSREDIKNVLPHREPFLLVDEVTHMDENGAEGFWDIKGDEYFFQGHFPGKPILPGVLIAESLAQLGAVALLSRDEYKGKIPMFGGIDGARFRRQVVPGERLELKAELLRLRATAGTGKGIATVNGEKVCEMEFMFFISAV